MDELIEDEETPVVTKTPPRRIALSVGVLASMLGTSFGYGESMQRIKTLERDQGKMERYQRRANEIFDERLRNIEISSGVPKYKIRPSITQELPEDVE